MNTPFHFHTQFHLVTLLGLKAKNSIELLDGIKKVPPSSIYYHTHRFLQQHHYLSPEPPNDFAYWLTNILNLKRLGEAFASVDTVSFANMEELRSDFIGILTEYISEGRYVTECQAGEEFHFMACKTFVLPMPYVAHNLREFAETLDKISIDSLYFHMFEAPRRLGRQENDFSMWFKSIGENELAKRVSGYDPYTMTLESLRQRTVGTVRRYAKY